jgi:tRNA-dihydrouridine synthase B
MKLPNLRAELRLFAAPLAGVSDTAYRFLAKKMGADYTFTEMVSSEGLYRRNRRTLDMLRRYQGETAVGCQLFGTKPEALADAAQTVEDQGFNSVDLNCGCPVHKVVNKCGGAALLKDLPLLGRLIETSVKRISIPFSIKIRSGWNAQSINYLEVGKVAEQAGAAYVCLHARTQSEFFKTEVRLDHIRELKESLSIPVIGNGGIRTAEDAVAMFRLTGCDAVMIASGTLGNPFLYREIKSLLDGEESTPPSSIEWIDTCLEHVRLLVERWGEAAAIKRSRKLLGWYFRHIVNRSKVDPLLFTFNTYAEVEEYFQQLLPGVRENAA